MILGYRTRSISGQNVFMNKDAASVTGCLLKNFRLASLKLNLKYFKH
jgi:hypothetical protein